MASQKGGKFIASGVYGCVFDKPLKCKEGTKIDLNAKSKKVAKNEKLSQQQMIGKLTTKAGAMTEAYFAKIFNQIPEFDNYFILSKELCTPAPKKNQSEEDLDSCKAPIIKNKHLPDLVQITQPFGGTAMMCLNPKLCMNSIPKRLLMPHFYKIAQHLLEAGTMMLIYNVVHFDLHLGNILYNQESHVAKIIDMGMVWSPLLINEKTVIGLERYYDPKINQESPECTVANGILEFPERSLDYFIEDIFNQKGSTKMATYVLNYTKEEQMKDLNFFIRHSASFSKKNWVDFYKLYWTKFDAWAIGIDLLKVYNDMLYESGFQASEDFQKNVLRNLVSTDAYSRFDCAEALTAGFPESALLKNPKVIEWLQVIKEHRRLGGATSS